MKKDSRHASTIIGLPRVSRTGGVVFAVASAVLATLYSPPFAPSVLKSGVHHDVPASDLRINERAPVRTTADDALRATADAVARVVAKRYRVSSEATREFVRAAFAEGRRSGLDPMLIVAVMAIESRFNPVAQSEMGAMGLMQIIPRFHPDKVGSDDEAAVLDPRNNIRLGTLVLREYIKRAGTETAGLQMYNGASDDASNAYATRVIEERDRLRKAAQQARGA